VKYNFLEIEKKWQLKWKKENVYKANNDAAKPKFYVLDMFPYPSGAGLHVGHPLGYIASDIYSRYKRAHGFNVLHPIGFDAFGLPAEQYAIQTGQHPSDTTEKNIKKFKKQLKKIGLSFDWDREVKTCDPKYYHWTQWAFIQMFHHYYCNDAQQARPVKELIEVFEIEGNSRINATCNNDTPQFNADDWKNYSEKEKQIILLKYRIAYLADTYVNWCPKLGTVLANDEVQDGYSVRGGYPVYQKKMKQWLLRISAYAQRLYNDLDKLNWTHSLKETQKNWIGRSEGVSIYFPVKETNIKINVFTTRPDTIFGATFMVLAPENELIEELTRNTYKNKVSDYLEKTKQKTEKERLSNVKTVSGAFTGSYAINPFTNKEIPIWISDYVLEGYGTGAIMAVPAHDNRDHSFAQRFNLPIVQVISGDISSEAHEEKKGKLMNSDGFNNLDVNEAIPLIINEIENRKVGKRKVNFKIRDAIFSRQRYWGEPFPIYYKDDIPYTFCEDKLPLKLPEIDSYFPTEKGQTPLERAENWQSKDGYQIDTNTMPGFAGSSAYYLRYMDPLNDKELVSKEANEYWKNVDLYVGGTEHATGHLIYARFWNKFLYDIDKVCKDEPFEKLINQGMIQGRSNFVYQIKDTNTFVSYGLHEKHKTIATHVDVNLVQNDILDLDSFKQWNPAYKDAEFILEDGKYICGWTIEKMSKSLFNVVNPDHVIVQYGADTLRLYEMFLGPLEKHKPWNTQGIEGVHKFLNKLWRLFFFGGDYLIQDKKPSFDELKILHKTIKKIKSDIESFSMNTAVSTFMIAVNELMALNCHNKQILEPFLIILAPFAPHITEELWEKLGHTSSIMKVHFPEYNEKYLEENEYEYPISFNGKVRFKMNFSLDTEKHDMERQVLAHNTTKKWLNGKKPKKIIIVSKKIINLVV